MGYGAVSDPTLLRFGPDRKPRLVPWERRSLRFPRKNGGMAPRVPMKKPPPLPAEILRRVLRVARFDGISVLGSRLYVNTLTTNKIFMVPIEGSGKAGPVTEIKLDHAINHPDGMRSFGKDSVLVAEGGGKGRLSRIKITDDSAQVTLLKEGYPDGAVSVTVVGTTAYVLEGQLAELFGKPDPNQAVKPFHATAVEVGNP